MLNIPFFSVLCFLLCKHLTVSSIPLRLQYFLVKLQSILHYYFLMSVVLFPTSWHLLSCNREGLNERGWEGRRKEEGKQDGKDYWKEIEKRKERGKWRREGKKEENE